MKKNKQQIESQIKKLMSDWVTMNNQDVASRNKVRYAGPVFDESEYHNIMDAIFNDWWSGGKFTVEAEIELSKISNRNHSILTNSGSSANLLLMSAAKELYFKDGDQILTLACGFPTTVNPIIQNRLVPMFVDIDLNTLNVDPELVRHTVKNNDKIKGIFVAHTLGFVNEIDELLDISREYGLQLFFDNCDSYGSTYKNQPVQAYGKAVSYSFYVAHHISMGEGGGIGTNDDDFLSVARSMRNWGRYCAAQNCCIRSVNPELFCPTGRLTRDCELPDDYNVNYQYEYLGYNLKPIEMQSAMLLAQLKKLDLFTQQRRNNYQTLSNYFNSTDQFRTWKLKENESPFAFPLLINHKNVKFKRKHFMDHLKRAGIETRLLFGGNLMYHPAFTNKQTYWDSFGNFDNSNEIMNHFVMLGVSPVNTEQHIQYIINTVDEFLKGF